MKIGLGTVQFGLDYGITNQKGKINNLEIRRILELAEMYHIQVLDTAALYGESETILGEVLQNDSHFNIITKTPRFLKSRITTYDIEQLESAFKYSLAKLQRQSIYGLLVHNADDLLSKDAHLLIEKMQSLKLDGFIRKIGVSVYHPDQLARILERYTIDLVQIPCNVFDQRFLTNVNLGKLRQCGIEVHARSIFLQGTLLMPFAQLPACFKKKQDHFKAYYDYLFQNQYSALDAALGFVTQQEDIDCCLVGVCSVNQLSEILLALPNMRRIQKEEFLTYASVDQELINPARWKTS